MEEFDAYQDKHSEAWFLFLATSRWLAVRLDWLCAMFVTAVTVCSVLAADSKIMLLCFDVFEQVRVEKLELRRVKRLLQISVTASFKCLTADVVVKVLCHRHYGECAGRLLIFICSRSKKQASCLAPQPQRISQGLFHWPGYSVASFEGHGQIFVVVVVLSNTVFK